MWFEELMGFQEKSPENVRNKVNVKNNQLLSSVNGRSLTYGALEIPTLAELEEQNRNLKNYNGQIKVAELVADVQELHCKPENANALFQAASQFNLLEMVAPNVTPEQGIEGYEYDHTQGPACAIACGAGTIYRNYFVEVNGSVGQSADNQIDCLDLIGEELQNEALKLWKMQNGYALVHQDGLVKINEILDNFKPYEGERLKGKLKTGIQWNTEVTLTNAKQKVTQIYCSALPVAYTNINAILWESFARLILEATYESTLHAGVLNMERNNSNKVFLTMVGGGAFGNEENWILESMQKALRKFKHVPLDIKVVSYGQSNPNLVRCLNKL